MEYRKKKRKFTLNEQKIIGGPTLGMVCGVTSVGGGGGRNNSEGVGTLCQFLSLGWL